ncbi:hypothetical protein RchiOBHm_Chr5g0035061 [Rosa chinensis]|uniref:Uncharacterized protein n=1 Tax=Rosa chinensis TaxID=74649 RepID=A0A2P6QB38_ROSCH|nr:hypothetical protein RchiOBHm_Chr5g0035061 [Rosa chinensis]
MKDESINDRNPGNGNCSLLCFLKLSQSSAASQDAVRSSNLHHRLAPPSCRRSWRCLDKARSYCTTVHSTQDFIWCSSSKPSSQTTSQETSRHMVFKHSFGSNPLMTRRTVARRGEICNPRLKTVRVFWSSL